MISQGSSYSGLSNTGRFKLRIAFGNSNKPPKKKSHGLLGYLMVEVGLLLEYLEAACWEK